MTLKHLLAWLLLLTISLQWIGGVIYLKLSQASLIEQEMDETEAVLAEKLALEYGIQSRIKVLDEEQQEAILNLGYGTPFIFSLSDEGKTDYFTLEGNAFEVIHTEFLVNGPEKRSHAGKALLTLNKLFSPYIINRPEQVTAAVNYNIPAANFNYHPLRDLFYRSIPTPPPSFAG